ncbi:MAG: hypothetical protein IIU94_08435, partial [Alistipes sp.]|nr:hypothetical protein [Alistipes sp.]
MKRILLTLVSLFCATVLMAQVKAGAPYVDFTVLADHADCHYRIGEEPRLRIFAKGGGTGLS